MIRALSWSCLFLFAPCLSCATNTDPPVHGGAPVDDDDAADDDAADDDDDSAVAGDGFPDYITANDDYFITRINGVPDLDEDTFRLSITGLVDNPVELTVDELRMRPSSDVTVTLECIGNPGDGGFFSTAVWEGFTLFDLIESLGFQAGATHARFECADGYWSSLSLEQLQYEGVIGALQMNGVDLPSDQGWPMRVVAPGYYGVKHPMWVTEIELIDAPIDDFWEMGGWDCSPTMPVDSKFFFPASGSEVALGVPFEVGGAAFGGTRVDRVEITADDGVTWLPTEVVRQDDLDHVWMFRRATITPATPGQLFVYARATDQDGNTQPREDGDSLDGTDRWPLLWVDAME